MEVKRIFDIPYYSKAHFEKDDFVCDKRNGKWEKISTDEYIRITNQLSRALLKYGIKKGDLFRLLLVFRFLGHLRFYKFLSALHEIKTLRCETIFFCFSQKL